MIDKQPTQEQIKEFWEWCGQYKGCGYCDGTGRIYSHPDVYSQCSLCGGEGSHHPILDLNNLFKYAVPKLQPEVIKIVPMTGVKEQFDYGQGWACHLTLKEWIDTKAVISNNSDPALALFWAIYQVVKGEANE